MGAVPTTTNTTAATVDSGIVAAGNDIVSAVELMAIAQFPFLGYPVFKPIWEKFFSWIAGLFIKAAEKGATFAVIDVQVTSEESSVAQATQEILAAEKSGDPAALIKAEKDYANAQSSLIHSDGSASPQ